MRYYISDLHFDHHSLNERMDCRGFPDAETMNAYMISRWNARVKDGDEVVILGDFTICPSGETVNKLLDSLNGKKCLIVGNHDRFLESRRFQPEKFEWIADYKELHDNKRKVILSHYPIMCYNGQYRRDKTGEAAAYMLYGHVHNSFDEYLVNEYQKYARKCSRPVHGMEGVGAVPCQMLNCFCMFSDYTPLTLDEWIAADRRRREQISLADYEGCTVNQS